MAEPWIRVHAALIDKPVVDRAAEALSVSEHEAIGLLVTFWGAVSSNVIGGMVGTVSDRQLERWARWHGRRGLFAKFIRDQHLDADGRVNEWDQYAGALEQRRATERDRLRNKRRGVAQPLQDVAIHARERHANDHANDTTRDEYSSSSSTPPSASTPRESDHANADGGDAIAGVIGGEPQDAAVVLAMAANRGITERWGEQADPIRAHAGTSLQAVEALRAAGVPTGFARDAIYTWLARGGCARDGRPPRSLKYFVGLVCERWAASQSAALAANSDAQLLPELHAGHRADGPPGDFESGMARAARELLERERRECEEAAHA